VHRNVKQKKELKERGTLEGIRKPEAAPLARVTSDDALLNMLVKEKRKKKRKGRRRIY